MTESMPQNAPTLWRDFEIADAGRLRITDRELTELLTQVYVEGGFTTPETAATLFEAAAVKERGILIGARNTRDSQLAGMVIVVPPNSPARRLAKGGEAELHLLGVKLAYRRQGLARKLVETAVATASGLSCPKMLLWTQSTMHAAHKLYESAGFLCIGSYERDGREFKTYEKTLNSA